MLTKKSKLTTKFLATQLNFISQIKTLAGTYSL